MKISVGRKIQSCIVGVQLGVAQVMMVGQRSCEAGEAALRAAVSTGGHCSRVSCSNTYPVLTECGARVCRL